MNPASILYVLPFFFLLIGAEWLYGYLKKKDYYRLNDSLTNLMIGIGNQVFNLFFKAIIFGLFIWIKNRFGIFSIPDTWWSFVLCLLLFDFLFYWAHRWGHEMNLFWGAHAVHHQSEEYNLSVALRQSWFHNLLAFFIFLPIPILGFGPLTFGIAAAVHTLYQFWIHTKAIGKLHPWIEYWWNTPSHHRVHHSADPKYLDKNHAGVFMIWDRMFGTFKEEEEGVKIHYGITTQLKSWNPAWANLQYYVEMWDKARNMKWADKFRMIFARPGWLPDYMGGFQAPQEVDDTAYKKYNADTNLYLKIYAVIQFAVLIWGTVQYMAYFKDISTFYKLVFFALILITMLIIGGIFEKRRWIMYAEYVRLALVMVSLNTFYYFWHLNWFNATIIISSILFVGCVAFFSYSWYTLFMEKQTRTATVN